MEMIYIDFEDCGRRTNVGAEFETKYQTKRAFESLRNSKVEIDKADFICDLYEENGDLIDSIGINAVTFNAITGEPVLSEAEYISIDEKYWEQAISENEAYRSLSATNNDPK